MKVKITRQDKVLSEILSEYGIPLKLHCGGHGKCGKCGKCRVLLVSGEWEVKGKKIVSPADAPANQTFLLSETGEVEIPEKSLAVKRGKVSSDWHTVELPKCGGTVVGIDIGTTTLAVVKICNGEITAKASCYNPQSSFGDNVVSRINYAATGGLGMLQKVVVDSIKELIEQMGDGDVSRMAVAGNTVMTCLFHGIDPSSIGVMPFTPPARIFPVRNDLFGNIPVFTVPAIAGYVGGDLTAGFAETKLEFGEMLVDIGTNCEIILHAGHEIFCTAAAAGPAFEGAGVGCGCLASDGVMDHYFGNGRFSVLGGLAPRGLCGSAMVDFLAVERSLGHLNEFGRIQPKSEIFRITDDISMHEWDIEQLLKAKAAVMAGIMTLENHCGVKAEKIYLAGGFSQYLDLKNAVAIGMLPERDFEVVGNTSLAGAARLACDPGFAVKLEHLADQPKEIPLNTLPDFEDNFIDSLMLP